MFQGCLQLVKYNTFIGEEIEKYAVKLLVLTLSTTGKKSDQDEEYKGEPLLHLPIIPCK